MARKPDTRTGSRHVGTAKSFRFSDAELALLDAGAEKHGSQKAAIVAGLRAITGANDTDIPAELRRLAAEVEARMK